jgi:hypothetical protein
MEDVVEGSASVYHKTEVCNWMVGFPLDMPVLNDVCEIGIASKPFKKNALSRHGGILDVLQTKYSNEREPILERRLVFCFRQ